VVLHSSRKKERKGKAVAVGGRSSCLLGRARACGAVRAQSGGRDPKRRRARRDRTRRSYGLQGATQPRRPAAIMMRGTRGHMPGSRFAAASEPQLLRASSLPLSSRPGPGIFYLPPSFLPVTVAGAGRSVLSFYENYRATPYPVPTVRGSQKKKFPPSVTNQLAQRKGKPNQTPCYSLPLSLLSGAANLLRTKLRMKRSETGIFSALDLEVRRKRHRMCLDGPDRGKEPGCVRPPHPR
jgi:hypothetical protein